MPGMLLTRHLRHMKLDTLMPSVRSGALQITGAVVAMIEGVMQATPGSATWRATTRRG
jgi:hypothetical protein